VEWGAAFTALVSVFAVPASYSLVRSLESHRSLLSMPQERTSPARLNQPEKEVKNENI
jgi:hypothetical protein